MTTLIQCPMALKHTHFRSTTWPIICEYRKNELTNLWPLQPLQVPVWLSCSSQYCFALMCTHVVWMYNSVVMGPRNEHTLLPWFQLGCDTPSLCELEDTNQELRMWLWRWCKLQRNSLTCPGDCWRPCTSKGVWQKRKSLHWTKYFEWGAEADLEVLGQREVGELEQGAREGRNQIKGIRSTFGKSMQSISDH